MEAPDHNISLRRFTKDIMLGTRVTRADAAVIEKRASEACLSKAEFLRQAAVNCEVRTRVIVPQINNTDWIEMARIGAVIRHYWTARVEYPASFASAITSWYDDRMHGRPCNHQEIAAGPFSPQAQFCSIEKADSPIVGVQSKTIAPGVASVRL